MPSPRPPKPPRLPWMLAAVFAGLMMGAGALAVIFLVQMGKTADELHDKERVAASLLESAASKGAEIKAAKADRDQAVTNFKKAEADWRAEKQRLGAKVAADLQAIDGLKAEKSRLEEKLKESKPATEKKTDPKETSQDPTATYEKRQAALQDELKKAKKALAERDRELARG